MTPWDGFARGRAPGSGRTTVQLTQGDATCYPLYYFIPTFTADGRHLVHHRAGDGEVQVHVLDLATGASRQLTHGRAPRTQWIPWCVESGRGVLDHRSVLDTQRNRLIYFDDNDVRAVALDGAGDTQLFPLPEHRIAIGQNCVSGDGAWFVYIHHDRALHDEAVYPDRTWGHRARSRGTALAAFHLETGEHRELVRVNSPIHHVIPLGDDRFVFCHPATENGMLLTDLRGGWYTHLRTQDDHGGTVCHYLTTTRGLMYEVLGRDDHVLAGVYNPSTHARYEFPLPESFGYTHTGRDPEGRLWFYENSGKTHDVRFLEHHDPQGEDRWQALTGDWPTYGSGQKSHMHPQLTPDRHWMLMTAGDPATQTNHIYLLDIADLPDTTGIPAV